MRNLLWEGIGDTKSPHLVRWNIVMLPKSQGGLGIDSIVNANLLIKWLRRIFTEQNSLWVSLIKAKHNTHLTEIFPSTWKFSSSRAPWFHVIKLKVLFHNLTKWKVGNGEHLLFWFYNWTDFGPLHLLQPRLFVLSAKKTLLVAEAWNSHGWNFYPRRPLLDRESSFWSSISASFQQPSSDKGSDQISWFQIANGTFSVKGNEIPFIR